MAHAHFLNAMSGSSNAGETETVIWSSSDGLEPGWGLMDYARHANVDKWLKERVLLPASKKQCAIPAGIFAKAQSGMARGIAYGQELNLAQPPRPTGKRIAWKSEWAAKVRVKSLTMVTLGDEGGAGQRQPTQSGSNTPDNQPSGEEAPSAPERPGLPDLGKALKGLPGA